MSDTQNIEEEIIGIVDGLNCNEVKKETQIIKSINPVDEFRSTVFSFYEDRLERIKKDEALRMKVEAKLAEKIETDDLSTAQLISLSLQLRESTTDAIHSMLGILKPVPNAENQLLSKSQDDRPEDHLDYNKVESESLSRLIRMMQVFEKLEKEGTTNNT